MHSKQDFELNGLHQSLVNYVGAYHDPGFVSNTLYHYSVDTADTTWEFRTQKAGYLA